jgi:hypothetical protein
MICELHATLAPRMLLALQDAAEQMIRTVPTAFTALTSPLHRDHLLATLNILERQSAWLVGGCLPLNGRLLEHMLSFASAAGDPPGPHTT